MHGENEMIEINIQHWPVQALRALTKKCENPEMLRELLEFNEDALYRVVAQNRYASQETLLYLYEKYKQNLALELAKNISTPQIILRDIAYSCSLEVALILIENTSLQERDIRVLINRFEEDIEHEAMTEENATRKKVLKVAKRHLEIDSQVAVIQKTKKCMLK